MKGECSVIVLTRIVSLCVGQFTFPTVEVDLTETVNIPAPAIFKQVVCVTPERSCQVRVGLRDDQLTFLARFCGAPRGYGAVIRGSFGYAHFSLNPGERPCLRISCEGLVAAPGATKYDAAVLGCPVRVDVVLADVVHRKLLNSWRYRLCTEGAGAQRRHVKVRHFASACRVCHDRFEEC